MEEEEEITEEKIIGDAEFSLVSIWDCGSPLYDSFEICSLCHIIDRHMMKLPFLLSRSSPEREGRMAEVAADALAVRRLKIKKEKRWKGRRGVGLKAIFSAILFWKKFNYKSKLSLVSGGFCIENNKDHMVLPHS